MKKELVCRILAIYITLTHYNTKHLTEKERKLLLFINYMVTMAIKIYRIDLNRPVQRVENKFC